MSGKPLTGRKVFLITAGAFGVIIGVNLVMAYQAVGTFPGLEVRNGYVASQSFDADRAAQERLGWQTVLSYSAGSLRLSITDAGGAPVQPAGLKGLLGRPTTERDDQVPAFAFDGSDWVAPVELASGNWNLRITATAADGTRFQQRLVLHVKDPA